MTLLMLDMKQLKNYGVRKKINYSLNLLIKIKSHGNKLKNTSLKEPKKCAIVDIEDYYHKQSNHGQSRRTKE